MYKKEREKLDSFKNNDINNNSENKINSNDKTYVSYTIL